ncbi:hypothetical protein HQ584_07205 [Patescibacteria group bacterium]|nr:hypothetical protein [Patescibacteria group bacterium]
MKIGDNVIIKKSIVDDTCPIDLKYIGKKGSITAINNDRPSPISVKVNDIGTDSFWPEELQIIN